MRIKKLIMAALIVLVTPYAFADRSPADLNDLEMAHVAYTADNIDIRYAHLALALTRNQAVRDFAKTMIRDHSAVNKQALALLNKLQAQPQDNFLSRALEAKAEKRMEELIKLRGAEFDKSYAEHEFKYHKTVNKLVETAFIPNIENIEVQQLFTAGLAIFKAHQKHAEMMMKQLDTQ